MRDRGTAPGSRGCPRRSGSEKPEGAAAAGGGATKCPSFSPSRAAPRPPQPRGAQPAPPHSALAHHVPVDPALGAAGAAGSGRCGAVPGWPAAWLPSPAQRQEQVSGALSPLSVRGPCVLRPRLAAALSHHSGVRLGLPGAAPPGGGVLARAVPELNSAGMWGRRGCGAEQSEREDIPRHHRRPGCCGASLWPFSGEGARRAGGSPVPL